MNELVLSLGLAEWKPLATTLLLPPVPWLLLVLLGGWQISRRLWLGWLTLWTGVLGIWLCSTTAVSDALTLHLLQAPPALSQRQLNDLKSEAPSSPQAKARTAIVVLGGGRRDTSAEYGTTVLLPRSVERLRYGLWLSRRTGLPVAFSGGIGRGGTGGPTEAALAAAIARDEHQRPLRWLEAASRDTRENAIKTVAMLRADGVEHIVLVTHATHMRRAMRHFVTAAAGSGLKITAAPTGRPTPGSQQLHDWLPSQRGMEDNWLVWREWWGWQLGA